MSCGDIRCLLVDGLWIEGMSGFWASVVVVGLGSGLGAIARYLGSLAVLASFDSAWPWATLGANGLGAWLIGFYARLSQSYAQPLASLLLRQWFMVGFCGGFTTFSLFSLETLMLVEQQAWGLAGLYISVSLLLWLFAVWLGYYLAHSYCNAYQS